MRKYLFLLSFLLLAAPAAAAGLRLETGPGGPGFLVAIQDHPVPGGRAGLGVFWRAGPGLATHLRYSTTWGPLGNVVADLDAAVTTSDWSVQLAGRAVLGPVSVRLRAGTWTTGLLPLLRTPDSAFPERFSARTDPVHALDVGATYRVSRDLLVLADITLATTSGTTDLRHDVELRAPRLVHGHELRILTSALHRLTPRDSAATGVWSAFGAGLHINRQRAAPWTVMLLLGGGHQIAPGVRLNISESFGSAELRFSMRAEPWRTDVSGLLLEAGGSGPVSGGTLHASVSVAGWPADVSAALSFVLPLE